MENLNICENNSVTNSWDSFTENDKKIIDFNNHFKSKIIIKQINNSTSLKDLEVEPQLCVESEKAQKMMMSIERELFISPIILGYQHSAENIIEYFIKTYPVISVHWILLAGIKYRSKPQVLILILRVLASNWSNISLKDHAICFCISCLSHMDDDVREETINAFEMLDDLKVIDFLQTYIENNENLDNFRKSVIEDKKQYYGICS